MAYMYYITYIYTHNISFHTKKICIFFNAGHHCPSSLKTGEWSVFSAERTDRVKQYLTNSKGKFKSFHWKSFKDYHSPIFNKKIKAYWLGVSLPSGYALWCTKCQQRTQTLNEEYISLSMVPTDPEANMILTDSNKSLQLLNWITICIFHSNKSGLLSNTLDTIKNNNFIEFFSPFFKRTHFFILSAKKCSCTTANLEKSWDLP